MHVLLAVWLSAAGLQTLSVPFDDKFSCEQALGWLSTVARSHVAMRARCLPKSGVRAGIDDSDTPPSR